MWIVFSRRQVSVSCFGLCENDAEGRGSNLTISFGSPTEFASMRAKTMFPILSLLTGASIFGKKRKRG